MLRAAIVAGVLLALSGCSSAPMRELQQLLWTSKGDAAFATGMGQYENGQYVESARNLQAAVNLGLPAAQRARAHKHLAFIHCASGRERLCREDFRKALAVEPKMELTAAEAGHPVWGPIFRSMKGGEPPLSAGLRLYEEGKYEESATTLQGAIERGLPDRDRARAHKHLAFMHCAANRERQCRDEFRRALDFDPGLQLTAAESGHPAWGPVFRSMNGPSALSAGLKLYEAGEYEESAKNLQGAIELGVPDKQRADAHKYLAFIHCASNRERQCRDEFRKALSVDPALELGPAEAGHPVWGPIFRSVKSGK